ncbi:hypothetical protein ANN_18683 [Periplaneta americana]|uniref:Uncharacterized protein n=1 Tax=Periplaneta americana TaxID=6978 RepID=A0ABQ8SQN4_PERAM|nr:hypothetical protein ANN_18683 [Periplaneta americana]
MKLETTIQELLDPDWISDLAFLTDPISHLNAMNTTLQRKDRLIVSMIDSINAFMCKLNLMKAQLDVQITSHFPSLDALENKRPHLYHTYSST